MSASGTEPCILLVDDHEENLHLLGRILARSGFHSLVSTTEAREALPLFLEHRPDLVLLDLHMPHLDGFGVMEALRAHVPEGTYLPILCLTADVGTATRRRALASGASDFLSKPLDGVEVVLRIRNLLQTRALHCELERRRGELEVRVRERTRELEETQVEVLDRLAQAAEFRDDETGQHTRRVGESSAATARALGLSLDRVEVIRRAAPLHDVGKIGIPDAILRKADRLTPEEYEVMKTHTLIGSRILSGGRSELMVVAERIARAHHERWDGAGYPHGLRGEEIPLEARIVAVADVYDALAHDRVYRTALDGERVRAEIRALSGSHFDPEVVNAFLSAQVGERTRP